MFINYYKYKNIKLIKLISYLLKYKFKLNTPVYSLVFIKILRWSDYFKLCIISVRSVQ